MLFSSWKAKGHMKDFIRLCLAVSLCTVCYFFPAVLASEEAVDIRSEIDSDMFPDLWRRPEVNASAIQLAPDRRVAIETVRKAVLKYPTKLLKDNLERVYVVASLSFKGINAAGTNSRRRIYLVDYGQPRELEMSFHHEFSSILLRNYWSKFDIDSWMLLLPSGFHYGTKRVKAVIDNAKSSINLKNAEQGFLSEYSKSSIENDVNLISERLFMKDADLKRLCIKYPAIRGKVELFLKFLHSIDESLYAQFSDFLVK